MLTTANEYCRLIVDTIGAHGIRTAYCSPGSRNAPLLLALEGHPEIKKSVVVDERSAAFQALGCSLIEQQPVVLVCTSGSAVLNYAPAVAEAYYAGIPLIVVSADRPSEWIDQDDSQTIHQLGALENIVKGSFDLRAVESGESPESKRNRLWEIGRRMNEALILAKEGKPGPVHINVQIDDPSGYMVSIPASIAKCISQIPPEQNIAVQALHDICALIKDKKIMLVAGFMQPCNSIDRAVRKFASLPNVAVFAETISNLHNPQKYSSVIDSVLCRLSPREKEDLRPDIVISIGGALVSRMLKQYLRHYPPTHHLSIGHSNYFGDCFKCLSMRVDISPANVLSRLSAVVGGKQKDSLPPAYAKNWHDVRRIAFESVEGYLAAAPWSDMKAMDMILRRFPNDNVFLSNGTPVRYAQIIPHDFHAEYCNRGVSGIDGCTSTAVGAARAYKGFTSMISGDMSWLYDSGASVFSNPPDGMRFFVIDNGGGGIFRFIKSTSSIPEEVLREYFCTDFSVDIKAVAEAYEFNAREADNAEDLLKQIEWMADDSPEPKLLLVRTPPEESARVLKNFFS